MCSTQDGNHVYGIHLVNIGRCERIRTSDPFLPKEVRYQAALHTELFALIVNIPNVPRSRGEPSCSRCTR